MWAQIPIIGWLIGFVFMTFMSVPFYFLWNAMAPEYFATFITDEWLNIPFWDCVWLFMLLSILKHAVLGGVFNKNIEMEKK